MVRRGLKGSSFKSLGLWYKNYFELEWKYFEYLKSLICLNAEPPQRIQLA